MPDSDYSNIGSSQPQLGAFLPITVKTIFFKKRRCNVNVLDLRTAVLFSMPHLLTFGFVDHPTLVAQHLKKDLLSKQIKEKNERKFKIEISISNTIGKVRCRKKKGKGCSKVAFASNSTAYSDCERTFSPA